MVIDSCHTLGYTLTTTSSLTATGSTPVVSECPRCILIFPPRRAPLRKSYSPFRFVANHSHICPPLLTRIVYEHQPSTRSSNHSPLGSRTNPRPPRATTHHRRNVFSSHRYSARCSTCRHLCLRLGRRCSRVGDPVMFRPSPLGDGKPGCGRYGLSQEHDRADGSSYRKWRAQGGHCRMVSDGGFLGRSSN
jgi:hypothetical protein